MSITHEDLDVTTLAEKMTEKHRARLEGRSSDEAYWTGYISCYCDQNAITDDQLAAATKAAAAMLEP